MKKMSASGGKRELGPCRLRLPICLGSNKSTMYTDRFIDLDRIFDLVF